VNPSMLGLVCSTDLELIHILPALVHHMVMNAFMFWTCAKI